MPAIQDHPRTLPCPTCLGTKTIKMGRMLLYGRTLSGSIPCPDCRGKGVIENPEVKG